MANKRDLKRFIRNVSGDVAGELVFAKNFIDGIDADEFENIVCEIAVLQVTSVDRVSVAFDRNLKSFDGNKNAYNKARRSYYKSCYGELKKEFQDALNGIISNMNALLPQYVKDANKAAMKK